MTLGVGTLPMKAKLIVVVGKPEGAIIPLALPQFKIGRGLGCQLRPNSDQVSREHAMFEVTSDSLYVQDLGSRNGTEVNGKRLNAHEPYQLKNGELVKIGVNTFAVSIEGAAVSATQAPTGPMKKLGSYDDASNDDIGAWLVSDASHEPPDRPSGVYGGETLTMAAFKAKEKPASQAAMPVAKEKPASQAAMPVAKDKPASKPAMPVAKAPVPVVVPEPEPEPEVEPEPEAVEDGIEQYQEDDGIEDLSEKVAAEIPEEFIDESNPFYVKKTQATPAASKEPAKDSSDAAHDILRRMMDRRKASKSS
jgi:predicted component of type VI protein secretion system